MSSSTGAPGKQMEASSGSTSHSNRLAGLLWFILKPDQRQKISPKLTRRELEQLNLSFQDWRLGTEKLRQKTVRELQTIIRPGQPAWPALLAGIGSGICFILFILHSLLIPNMVADLRIYLFGTLMMGVLAPLMLYFMSRPRRRVLLRPTIQFEWLALSFLAYLAGLWLMYHINALDGKTRRLLGDPFSLGILFVGVMSAPMLEEIIFRELFPSIFGKDPFFLGQLLSVLLFSALHLPQTSTVFILYILVSSLFAALRILTSSLIYSYLVHALINVMTLVLLL